MLGVLAAAQSETAIRRPGLSTATSSAPTCPSASINYITHRLAQQCLKTGYTAPTDRLNATSTATSGRPELSAPTHHTGISNSTSHPVSLNATTTTNGTVTAVTTSTSSESPSSTSVEISSVPTPEPILETVQADNENDSALDTAKFLSFEDWKNQNLAKAGQSAEHLGARANAAPGSERRRPENGNGLESFGEEAEIDIDFGFGGSPSTSRAVSTAEHGPDASTAPSGSKVSAPLVRSKDAGRTCKERFNYASFDCAANIIKTNARSKSANSILVENKDSYMLNECSISNKFLIVELCDDILVDTIVLANFEFFSSMFRTFKISVSDRYPVKAEKWKDLGTFEAKNSRSIQAFLVENPLIWARYLRVEFLSHYGSEYYCPVSLIRIHGTTMMEEFRHQEQLARGELDDEDEEEVEVEMMANKSLPAQVVVPAMPPSEKPVSTQDQASATTETMSSSSTHALLNSTASASGMASTDQATVSTTASMPDQLVESADLEEPEAVTITEKTTTTLYYRTTRSTESATSLALDATSPEPTSSAKNATTSSHTAENATTSTSSFSQPATVPNVSSMTNQSSSSISTASSTIPVPSAPPATQESFFKSIHKRLGSLESNATLSLQYIESQSALLRDAFASASKRQLARTTTFLDTLNSTISTELLRFKGEYDQLWQSTVLELAAQREEGRREREVLAEHVRLLAEEVVSQKRIVAVQAGLMLVCLGVVLLGQFGMGTVFGGSAFSPTYSKRGSINGLGRQQDYSNNSRANSPADPGNESAGSASAIGSAGKPPRHWRQRWRWDSPFRSGGNSGIGSSAVSSASKLRKPLPFERRVRSENDRTLLDARMQALTVQEDDDDDDSPARDDNLLSPNSPATASLADGTDGVSDVDVEGGDADSRDRSISASRGSSAGSDVRPTETSMAGEEDPRTPIHDSSANRNENERFPFGLLSVDDNNDGKELMQTRSAPTTPMA